PGPDPARVRSAAETSAGGSSDSKPSCPTRTSSSSTVAASICGWRRLGQKPPSRPPPAGSRSAVFRFPDRWKCHRYSTCTPSPVTHSRPRKGAGLMNEQQMQELLYQALQTEMGGVEVYETALRCVQNDELKEEWEEYLEQTERHVEIVQEIFTRL